MLNERIKYYLEKYIFILLFFLSIILSYFLFIDFDRKIDLEKLGEEAVNSIDYKYNISNVRNTNLSDIKTQGGVCWQYADIYENYLSNKSIFTKKEIIQINGSTLHEFLIISNHEGYCILDSGRVVFCQELVL
jgi:hypothetical protein